LLAQTREEGAGSPAPSSVAAISTGSRITGLASGSKPVAKKPRLAYPCPLDGESKYDNRKEIQALMAEPIKLEIFTDYV
jgi:hypothetical protein